MRVMVACMAFFTTACRIKNCGRIKEVVTIYKRINVHRFESCAFGRKKKKGYRLKDLADGDTALENINQETFCKFRLLLERLTDAFLFACQNFYLNFKLIHTQTIFIYDEIIIPFFNRNNYYSSKLR